VLTAYPPAYALLKDDAAAVARPVGHAVVTEGEVSARARELFS
jgi:hypothetical protein